VGHPTRDPVRSEVQKRLAQLRDLEELQMSEAARMFNSAPGGLGGPAAHMGPIGNGANHEESRVPEGFQMPSGLLSIAAQRLASAGDSKSSGSQNAGILGSVAPPGLGSQVKGSFLDAQPGAGESSAEVSRKPPVTLAWKDPDDAAEEADQQLAMVEAHRQGTCKPCVYFRFKADACRNGAKCVFCHLCSRQEIAMRRKEHKRALKAQLAELYGKTNAAGPAPNSNPMTGGKTNPALDPRNAQKHGAGMSWLA
jgi:hypothetical protein